MLADLDCGRWRGQTMRSIAEGEPDELGAWLTDPSYTGHGGRSIDELLVRLKTWLALRRDDPGTTLAITHAAVLRCALLATLGASSNGFWRIDAAPLTSLVLSSDGRRWTLRGLRPFEPA